MRLRAVRERRRWEAKRGRACGLHAKAPAFCSSSPLLAALAKTQNSAPPTTGARCCPLHQRGPCVCAALRRPLHHCGAGHHWGRNPAPGGGLAAMGGLPWPRRKHLGKHRVFGRYAYSAQSPVRRLLSNCSRLLSLRSTLAYCRAPGSCPLMLQTLTNCTCESTRSQVGDMDSLDAIFVPVGGGGLVAGIAAFVKALKPHVQVCGEAGCASSAVSSD